MGSRKRKKKDSTFTRIVIGLVKAPIALAFLWPVLLVVGGYLAWHQWGADHINRKYNSLSIEQISISPPPQYIRSDIVESVFRSTDLSRVSLLDVNATAQIANAFATNAWVDDVVRIQKTSQGRISVDVSYRRPVAMVDVISRHPEVEGPSFFAVDRSGVLLPTEDFSEADTHQYIHIVVKDTYPTSGVGLSFGDQRVSNSAAVAALLLPHREKLGVETISIAPREPHDQRPMTLVVNLRGGRTVVWGSAPGEELNNEPKAAAKLQALLSDPSTDSLQFHTARPVQGGSASGAFR